jgi:GNAT superfamily N-acetyltransferase
MTADAIEHHHIRRLWPADIAAFRRHLKRLDADTRQARFGSPVNDQFLEAYADTAHRLGTLIYGAFYGNEIRASAELRSLEIVGEAMAEAAFTVEKSYQDKGLGSLLMNRIIVAAQNRSISQLHMICLRDNDRMQHLAGKFGARLKINSGEVTGRIDPTYPTPVSVFEEALDEAHGFMTAVLDWRI